MPHPMPTRPMAVPTSCTVAPTLGWKPAAMHMLRTRRPSEVSGHITHGSPASWVIAQPASAGQRVVRRDAEPERVVPEGPLAQPRPGRLPRVAVARHDGHVELVAVDRVGAFLVADRGEPDLHVGEPPAHLRQRAAHDVRALAERDAHPQQPGDPRPGAGQRGLGRPQLHQDPLGVLHQRAAGRGERDVVARPVDQRGARLGLKRGYLLGHGRPGVLQAAGGRGDGPLGHDGLEHDQLAHVQHVKRHIH